MNIFEASNFPENSVVEFGNCGDCDWYLVKHPGSRGIWEKPEFDLMNDILEALKERVKCEGCVRLWHVSDFDEALDNGFPICNSENYWITSYQVPTSMMIETGFNSADQDCIYVARKLNEKYGLTVVDPNQVEMNFNQCSK